MILERSLNTAPNAAFAGGVGNMNSYLKAESRADVGKVSGDKEEYLSMLSGRGSGGKDVGKGTGNVNLKNIDEFIDGTKTFDDVVDDFARLYSEKIQTNKQN